MRRFLDWPFLYVLPRGQAIALALLILVVVAAADHVTSAGLGLTAFYMFGILIASWNAGVLAGLAFGVASSLIQIYLALADGDVYGNPLYLLVTHLNTFLTFLVVVVLTVQLRRLFERERDGARVDYLTSLANRRGFFEAAHRELARHGRYRTPLSVIYLDCDGFKSINDRLGHRTGDELLKTVGQTLKATLRATDIIARLGGDEFAAMLPDTGEDGAREVASRIQSVLAGAMADKGWPVTFSAGVGIFNRSPGSVDSMLAFCDTIMYRAKNGGKNNTLQAVYA